MNLRVVATAVILLLLFLALGAAASLVLMTTKLTDITSALGSAIESVRAAEELEVDLLTYSNLLDRLPQFQDGALNDGSEVDLRQRIKEMELYVGDAQEAALVSEVSAKVDNYLRIASQVRGAGEVPPEALREPLDTAFGALDRLVDLNVRQARTAEQEAAAWNQVANVGGLAIAGLLVVGAAGVLIWVWGFALRPTFGLATAIERFAAGDRSARAAEVGAGEMREMARRFNEMAFALERERENQLTFLSSVAHDLRNPLQVLRLSSSLASAGESTQSAGQLRKTLAVIGRQVDSLDRMVGDLLDATRIEAGHLELRVEPLDLRALGREVLELFSSSAAGRLRLHVVDEPLEVCCDSMRIGQVLNNLVSNAIKYSPAASPIDLYVGREGTDAVFAVRDQGIGIQPQEIGRIFEPFRRAGNAREVALGVGLGLSVARRIVEAHQGRIEVESTPGRGSTFRVRLPIVVLRRSDRAARLNGGKPAQEARA